jgi:hypothetical protein
MGSARVFEDGTIEASSHKIEPTINARCVAIAGLIERHSKPDCIGVCIEEPFSGQFASVKALFPMLGAAVLTCERLDRALSGARRLHDATLPTGGIFNKEWNCPHLRQLQKAAS